MRTLLVIPFLVTLAGCASKGGFEARWRDMQVDIAMRRKFEKYSCPNCLEGYSKDYHASYRPVSKPVSSEPKVQQSVRSEYRPPDATDETRQEVMRNSESVRELDAHIAALEEELKTNASTTNQNQQLIVDEIKSLKARLDQLQHPPPVVGSTLLNQ